MATEDTKVVVAFAVDFPLLPFAMATTNGKTY